MSQTESTKIVVALETYTNDGWYGTRNRYYYAGPEGQGFKNKTEAGKYKGKLKKYVKQLIKYRSKTEINGEATTGMLSEFPTYIYCGAGPSYSCSNVEVKNIEDRWGFTNQ
jgi:hypothetical protein